MNIVGIVGSLRKGSYNRSLMNAVKAMAPEGVTFTIFLMGQPEFYLGEFTKKFDADGVLTDQATKDRILKFWDAFLKDIRGGAGG